MKPEENARSHYRHRLTSHTASAIGAGAIGIGIGSILPQMPFGWPIAFLILGLVVHSFGMVRAHRADAKAGLKPPLWFQAITGACWIVLASLAAAAAFLLAN